MISVSVEQRPKLSVVVASQNAELSVEDCIRAIQNQCPNGDVEILVIDNSTDKTTEIVRGEFPTVTLFTVGREKLIPELWGIGIAKCNGECVALTTSHFVPSDTWAATILEAHEQPYAGIGGAIENEPQAGIVSWAVYFCRYSPYMLPFAEAEVEDFAADNASYKRRDLELVKASMQDGFWETFVHQEMRKQGMSLLKSPDIVVRHQRSFSFTGFMSQRFWHGRRFGSERTDAMPGPRRIAFILLSPLIPFIYLFRITRRVFAKKRNIGKLLLSLPVLVLFLLSWSTGELSGYLKGSEK